LHLHVIHADIDHIGGGIFLVTWTILFRTFDVIDVR
jgi:hypothetical protein